MCTTVNRIADRCSPLQSLCVFYDELPSIGGKKPSVAFVHRQVFRRRSDESLVVRAASSQSRPATCGLPGRCPRRTARPHRGSPGTPARPAGTPRAASRTLRHPRSAMSASRRPRRRCPPRGPRGSPTQRFSSGGAFGSNCIRTRSESVGIDMFTRRLRNCRSTSISRTTSGPRVCTTSRG